MPTGELEGYSSPHQFEPLLPQRQLEELTEKTRYVIEKSYELKGAIAPSTCDALRTLVRTMNSYYSNRIEGQGTHPRNIERALAADFSATPSVAQRQRIALAHIEAEKELEAKLPTHGAEAFALRSSFLIEAHEALYRRLAPEDRTTAEGELIEPGALRRQGVTVGRHHPPIHPSVPAFLRRMDEVYPKVKGLDSLLYYIASAHQRATWVHPFSDGNGRACRLQTHTALFPLTRGLWSVNRGLARKRDSYYAMLASADSPRQGDYDGRGNLSESGLFRWCEFFIDLAIDQVSFMGKRLLLNELRDRIEALVLVRSVSSQHSSYYPSVALALHHVLIAGPVARGAFMSMLGLSSRTATRVIGQMLKDKLLVSDSPKGPVSFNFPLDSLNLLLPNLYPEASTTDTDN